MKRTMNILLMAALVCGLSFAVTSCKDDDDDGNKDTEQKKDDVSKLDTDDARVAFRWLCVLANAQTLDDNWQSKTYEPTVGQASENDPFTRLVIVNDVEEAKVHFAKLADLAADQLATAQTVNGGAAGTMKWTPSKEGAQNLAVVEVSSRIMPHLQKLVYCTDEQTGQNGLLWDSMKGTAYYRLGDVVRDKDGYYWICVRPSFAPDKGDSHWINLYNASASGYVNGQKKPILEEHINKDYDEKTKYGGVTIKLPTKLPYDREHIYNLSQLLWAMFDTKDYEDVCLQNKNIGLGGFEYAYHGTTFLNLVADFWEMHPEGANNNVTLWEALFGVKRSQIWKVEQLNFVYQGYKWWWGDTGELWVYQSRRYEPKYLGTESGDKCDVDILPDGFDIRRCASDSEAKAVGYEQFDWRGNVLTEGNWVVRYKRGDKLSNTGKYDPYNKIPGCDDIYVFNKEMGVAVGPKEEFRQTESDLKQSGAQKNARVGYIVGRNGKFYMNKDAAEYDNTTAVAMVVYNNTDKAVETSSEYYGLAISLKDYGDTGLGEGTPLLWAEEGSREPGCTGRAYGNTADLEGVLNGIAMTNRMGSALCNYQHVHPAAKAVALMESPVESGSSERSRFSGWFIPSVGQYILAAKGVGYTWTGTGTGIFEGGGNWPWARAGITEDHFSGPYQTCTEASDESFYIFRQSVLQTMTFSHLTKVRPMVAFKR